MERPVSLQQFAEISAEIDAGRPLDAVLARDAIAFEAWTAAAERWPRRIAIDAEHGGPLERRFQEAYAAKLATLDAPAPAVAHDRSDVTEPDVVPAPVHASQSDASTEIDPAWAREVGPPPADLDFDARRTVALHDAPSKRPVLPFAAEPDTQTRVVRTPAPPAPALVPPPTTPPGYEDEVYGETRELRVHALRDPLPFKRDPSAPQSTRPAGLPPGVPSALPFRPAGEAGPPSSSHPPPSTRAPESYPSPPLPLGTNGPLVFPPAPALTLGTLTASSASHAAAAPTSPVVVTPAVVQPGRPPRLSLEQYAALAAEAAVQPAALVEVRARYGLDEPAHRAESDEWQRRFASDAELYAKYSWLFQGYRDYFAGER